MFVKQSEKLHAINIQYRVIQQCVRFPYVPQERCRLMKLHHFGYYIDLGVEWNSYNVVVGSMEFILRTQHTTIHRYIDIIS